jgi:hypothetical protein
LLPISSGFLEFLISSLNRSLAATEFVGDTFNHLPERVH